MKSLKLLGAVAALAIIPQMCIAEPARHVRKPHVSIRPTVPVTPPADVSTGNAALGGNNANSAFGSNSANENANGRSGGGFGG